MNDTTYFKLMTLFLVIILVLVIIFLFLQTFEKNNIQNIMEQYVLKELDIKHSRAQNQIEAALESGYLAVSDIEEILQNLEYTPDQIKNIRQKMIERAQKTNRLLKESGYGD